MVRWIELRRHSYTKKSAGRERGSHLSQAGVDAAHREGALLEDVAYVAVSQHPRTMETAIAMGFTVDDVVDIESSIVSGEVGFHEWWDWPNPWEVFHQRLHARPGLAEYGASQVKILQKAVTSIPDGTSALLIGHGGWIEPTVLAATAAREPRDYGPPFSHLEGVRLSFHNGTFQVEQVHRRQQPPSAHEDLPT